MLKYIRMREKGFIQAIRKLILLRQKYKCIPANFKICTDEIQGAD